MFDEILSLVKDHAAELLSADATIPAEQQEQASHEASQSILETLKEKVGQGKLTELTGLIGGNTGSDSPVTAAATDNLVVRLTEKLGLSPEQATAVASSIIPEIMAKFVQKANDPEDKSIDLKSMIGQVMGGSFNLGGMMGMVGGLFGKK